MTKFEAALKNLMRSEDNSIPSFTIDDILGAQSGAILIDNNPKKRQLAQYARTEIQKERVRRKNIMIKLYDSDLLTLIADGDYAASFFVGQFFHINYGNNELDFRIETNLQARRFIATVTDLKTKKILFERAGSIGNQFVADVHIKRKKMGLINRYLKVVLINYQSNNKD